MPLGRTPLFRKLSQMVRQARWLNENPQHRTFFFEAREAARVSRRDFVRMLGGAGLLTAAGGLAPRPAKGSTSLGAAGGEPVAIIGAVVAGLTAACRLLQAGVPCEIFEGSERIGGRMLTKYDFNKDAMFCELGGELVDSNHAALIALAGELGVGIQELKGEDKGVDLYFFGGKHYRDEQLIPLFQPFAQKLAADFDGIYDAEQNFTEKAARFDRVSHTQHVDHPFLHSLARLREIRRETHPIEIRRKSEISSLLSYRVLRPFTNSSAAWAWSYRFARSSWRPTGDLFPSKAPA